MRGAGEFIRTLENNFSNILGANANVCEMPRFARDLPLNS
jgi:hypothetical protein